MYVAIRNIGLVRGLQVVVRGLVVLAVGLLFIGLVGLLLSRAHGGRLLSVQTDSMVPALQPGDAVIVRPVAARDLREGDIISYQSPRDPSLIISHRLVRIDQETGWLTTAGDALRARPDPTFPPRLVVGRVSAVAPKFGIVLDAVRRPLGLAVVVYLPATVIIAGELRRLTGHYNSQRYRLFGYR